MISIRWAQDRPSSSESDMTVIPKSLEHQLKNLKLEIQKLEDKVEQLQENNQNQEIVISQLKTVNETTQSQLTELVKDLQVQRSRNDELEERFNALKRKSFFTIVNIFDFSSKRSSYFNQHRFWSY